MEAPEAYHFSPAHPSCQDSLFSEWATLGNALEVGTMPGERCALAHQGWVGENRDFFSIPLVE